MAKISLRAYNHEIENLIDRGQTEEGIAHCKYILKSYPKHLDTYRLLGKAYLESQRYSEAADILQRILSVQPDDFVSQIGMSIIREDEGNLDAAIYHMERAFEILPANVAIQDELRRLYSRRDGVEPSKLRMTRGALVRMYARGDLYRQAIAEVRGALKEDPQRLDLEIVLARMYFQTGLKAEAAEISSRLVGKLPYCYEANRILAEVLPETSRAEEAKAYQQKLIALDPYLAYLSDTVIDLRQVPENAVSLDRLEWSPSLESSQQPAWANSLGITQNQTENEKMPQWMITVPSSDTEIQPDIDNENTAQPFSEEPALFENQIDAGSTPDEVQISSQDNDLPDWMKSSGWGISNQPAQEQVETISESENLEAVPANIPDWLKEIAPESESIDSEKNISQNSDWINSTLPTESVQENLAKQSQTEIPVSEDITIDTGAKAQSPVNLDLPDWFNSSIPSADETIFAIQSNEPLPDWLTETPQMTSGLNIEEIPESVVPETHSVGLEEISLAGVESELGTGEAKVEAALHVSQPQSAQQDELTENVPDLANTDEALAWLESLAAKNDAEEATLIPPPEDRIEIPPEWVSQAASTSPDKLAPEIVTPAGELLADTALLSALNVPADDDSSHVSDVPISSEQSIIEPVVSEIDKSGETSMPDVIEGNIEPVDQVQLSEPVGQTLKSEPVDNILLSEPVDQTLKSEPVDMDAAFSWLESLAAKQGADADSLLVSADERQETPPDWVHKQAVEEAVNQSEPVSITETEPPVEQLQDWKQSLTETPAPSEAIQSDEHALPEWLNNIDSSSEQPFTHIDEQAVVTNEVPTVEEWIPEQDNQVPEIVSEQEESQPQANETAPEVSTDVERPATFGKTRPLPSWLMNDLGTAPNIEPAVSQPETNEDLPLPDWLKEETQPVSAQPSAFEIPAANDAPDLPDWLKNLEAEQEDETLPVPTISSQNLGAMAVPVVISNVPSEMLTQAQDALAKGQLDISMSIYGQLILQGQHVEETIHDLRDALYRYPVESEIWQALGDANFRNNHVQDALDAYTKAEELLK